MSEEAVRQTRSQKRALEREAPPPESEAPPPESEAPPPESEAPPPERKRLRLDAGEVKATIKLEVKTRDGHSEMKRERRSPSPDDVIVLSDEAPSPRVNGRKHCPELDTHLLMRSSAEQRKRVIKQLKEELHLEEAKLILLKKIRHSQQHKDSSGQKPAVSVSAAVPVLVKGSTSAKAAQLVASARAPGTVVPPPLVRGGQVTKPGPQNLMPPLVRGAQISGSASGPPPLLLAPRGSLTSVQGQKLLQPGLIRMASIPSASLLVLNQAAGANLKSSESLASRQAAAKLALRKQLEKALLDIPPPAPPAPQISFMPSAANNQFLCLLGLEEAVQQLLEALGRGKQGVYAGLVVSAGEPSCCSECETDFTCRWRRDKGGAILCEQCMSSNQKKLLKAEHTNRLKAAFVKALRQEQEMEQRILQQATPPASSSSAHGLKPRPLPAPIKQVSPAGIRALAFAPSSQLQSAVAAASLVNRPGVTMAYVNPSLSGHKSSSALERHREFLLDMIPARTANSWK